VLLLSIIIYKIIKIKLYKYNYIKIYIYIKNYIFNIIIYIYIYKIFNLLFGAAEEDSPHWRCRKEEGDGEESKVLDKRKTLIRAPMSPLTHASPKSTFRAAELARHPDYGGCVMLPSHPSSRVLFQCNTDAVTTLHRRVCLLQGSMSFLCCI
jgi:hypothetical protein